MPTLTPYLSRVQADGTIDGVSANPNDFGAQTGEALSGLGKQASQTGAAVAEVEDQKARMRTAADLTRIDLAARQQFQQMQVDPDFTNKYGEDGSGFAGAYKDWFEQTAAQTIQNTDPSARKYMEQGLYNVGASVYGSAQEFQAKTGAAFAVDTVKTAVDNARQSANISPEQYTSIMANANMVIDTAKVDPETRMKLRDAATQSVTLGAALGALDKGGVGAAQQLIAGKMVFVGIGPDGQPQKMPVRDIVNEKTYAVLKNQATSVIKKAEVAQQKIVADKVSDLMTSMAFAQTPDDFANISQSIEKGADQFGHIKTNEMRVRLHAKQKALDKQIQSVSNGSNYISGNAYLNPADSDGVKDFNNAYNTNIEPQLQSMPPEEKNTRLAQILSTVGVIPENLKGDVKAAARSMDPNVVMDKADFIDRVTQTNPHMLQDFDQKDLARIKMVNTLIGDGIPKNEAFQKVDDALDPNNASVYKERETALEGMKVNYKANAMSNFQGFVSKMLGQGISDVKSNFATRQISQITSEYKDAFDTQFKLTGDKDEATRFASQTVTGNYGISGVNGTNQLMKYAPEKYVAIENVDNSWMRGQVVDAAKKVLSNSLVKPGTTVDNNIRLVPDPGVTGRSAVPGRPAMFKGDNGTPLYRLMFQSDEGGALHDLGYFQFDPKAERQRLVDVTKEKAAAGGNYRRVDASGKVLGPNEFSATGRMEKIQ